MKDDRCVFEYDRIVDNLDGRPSASCWMTGCGYEVELPLGSQPRKHLSWNYCMFCGREIADATQDC